MNPEMAEKFLRLKTAEGEEKSKLFEELIDEVVQAPATLPMSLDMAANAEAFDAALAFSGAMYAKAIKETKGEDVSDFVVEFTKDPHSLSYIAAILSVMLTLMGAETRTEFGVSKDLKSFFRGS